ncbi:MAG TPA: zf-TFIIB domain-containing protein [Candidatus Saccharimonadales bacterium]|nr:zf-TFIIB domain-containing protein [Candidatus Saccharimonadales bacterium]
MKCPYCGGGFEAVGLQTQNGGSLTSYHCMQCGGFWLARQPAEALDAAALNHYDTPQFNYSLKAFNMACPTDGTMLEEDDARGPAGGRSWHCTECGGVFYPKGQLALLAEWQVKHSVLQPTAGLAGRTQTAVALSLTFGLVVAVLGALSSNFSLNAAGTAPLPTSGPNIITLLLLAVTYLAGTVLAVLGRRLPIIILGWAVIIVCLFGFSVLIFGP